MRSLTVQVLLGCLLVAEAATAGEGSPFSRKEDVIYGRKHGMALTMDVFTPKKANGAAVVLVMSGGWFSSHDWVSPAVADEFLKRGYTVFAVVHGSQPKFSIPEILDDMHRAVRFIRYHARDYHIDPNRIGIQGGSAGGHLALMQGTAGAEGDPKAKDPVDRVSSRVQAVACFFPPTDFLNYGEKGKDALGRGTLAGYKAPFDFTELDKKTGSYVPITDEGRRREIGRKVSPVYHVTKESAPALIIHGDADKLVPIQQAEEMVGRLKEAGVAAELVVKRGAGHGWKGLDKDMTTIADWFDRYLREKGQPPEGARPFGMPLDASTNAPEGHRRALRFRAGISAVIPARDSAHALGDFSTFATRKHTFGGTEAPAWYFNRQELIDLFAANSYQLAFQGLHDRDYDTSNIPLARCCWKASKFQFAKRDGPK